ncbi:MAG: hypothetical protein AAF992_11275 [Bacteroidota bacterium]
MKSEFKISKRWTWLTVLLIGMLSLGTISCDDDDNDDNNTVTPDPEGEEVESAWLTGFRIDTPQGRLWFMNVSEEVPEDYNIEESVELGLNKAVYSFGGNPYVWDGNARTLTKWAVDRTDLSLSPEGVLSIASTGFDALGVFPVFVSETQAFVTNLTEGLIIEWNPRDMTIIEVHQVEPLVSQQEGAAIQVFFNYLSDDKLIMPAAQQMPECCEANAATMAAVVGVFDVNTKAFQYYEDDRLMSGLFRMVTDENGSLYVQPESENSFMVEYFDFDRDIAPPPHTILRLNNDGSFDPDFELKLDDVLDIEVINEAFFVNDNKIVLTYIDSNDAQLAPAFSDHRDIFARSTARTVAVDITTGEVSNFTALDQYDFIIPYNVIDGLTYFICFTTQVEAFDTSHIVRQDNFDSYTELATYQDAAAQWVDKLWGD